MNWEALGAVAELLGAIGVIVTLLYLSRQINHNSKQLEGSSTIAVHNYLRTLTEEVAANPSLWATVRKANLDWVSLSEDERSLASLYFIKEAGFWEMAYRLHNSIMFSTFPNYCIWITIWSYISVLVELSNTTS